MHAFVRNVAVTAVLATLAGMSAATLAKAEQPRATNDSWYNSYADTSAAITYKSPGVSVVISKGTVKPTYRYKPKYARKKYRTHTGSLTRHGPTVDRPRYRSHASGYRW